MDYKIIDLYICQINYVSEIEHLDYGLNMHIKHLPVKYEICKFNGYDTYKSILTNKKYTLSKKEGTYFVYKSIPLYYFMNRIKTPAPQKISKNEIKLLEQHLTKQLYNDKENKKDNSKEK